MQHTFRNTADGLKCIHCARAINLTVTGEWCDALVERVQAADYETRLRDEVAMRVLVATISSERASTLTSPERIAFNLADNFMNERARRK